MTENCINHIYHHGETELHGYLVCQKETNLPRPAVIVVHDWSGRNEFACKKAHLLAEMGYVGFAIDVYGKAQVGSTNDEKKSLMEPLINDEQLLLARLRAGLDELSKMPEVDPSRIAVIGFCFGGLCALNLARSGANLVGAVSFHGLLTPAFDSVAKDIKSKLLVLHGYDDPMVSPADVNVFCQEMSNAQVDWQVHMYGNTKHAFSNPEAQDENLGTVYNPIAAERSWQEMENFLEELFN